MRVSDISLLTTLVLRLGRAEGGFDEVGAQSRTCSFTTGRVSNASTTAPNRRAVAMACSPATPAPITNTRAGVSVPAAVMSRGKNFGSDRAAVSVAAYPAIDAMDESTSSACARAMRGIASVLMRSPAARRAANEIGFETVKWRMCNEPGAQSLEDSECGRRAWSTRSLFATFTRGGGAVAPALICYQREGAIACGALDHDADPTSPASRRLRIAPSVVLRCCLARTRRSAGEYVAERECQVLPRGRRACFPCSPSPGCPSPFDC